MDPAECPICYVPITRQLSFAQCTHRLCLTCGVRWLFKKSFCPICRISSSTLLVVDSQNTSSAQKLHPKPSLDIDCQSEEQPEKLGKVQQKQAKESTKEANSSTTRVTEQRRAPAEERKMSLPELISTYWGDLSPEGKSEEESEKGDRGSGMEDVDISVFRGDLESVIELTGRVEANLENFNHHIFYSELFDVLADVKRTNEHYLEGLNERDPSISKYQFACFVEFLFKFLNELNSSLKERDMPVINYLVSVVDEVYYNSYMEYHFRGYEGSIGDFDD